MKHSKKKEMMSHTQGKKEQLIETVPEETHTLDLLDKDFKSMILYMFRELKEPCLKN